jgi:hypothetical protein
MTTWSSWKIGDRVQSTYPGDRIGGVIIGTALLSIRVRWDDGHVSDHHPVLKDNRSPRLGSYIPHLEKEPP